MAVEVEGIIYIFNPPDRTKLGDAMAAGTGAAPAAAEGAAANPGSAPPPAAAAVPVDNPGAAPVEQRTEPDAAPEREAGAEPDAAAGPAEMPKTDESPDAK